MHVSVGTYGALYAPTDVSVKGCPLLGSSSGPRMKPGSEKDFPRLSRKMCVFLSPSYFQILSATPTGVCVWGGGYP